MEILVSRNALQYPLLSKTTLMSRYESPGKTKEVAAKIRFQFDLEILALPRRSARQRY
jgi:hypothetical protein